MTNFWRITPAIAIATALMLVVAGLGLGIYSEQAFRAGKIAEAKAVADILAATVTAALTFDDHDAAREYVGALRVNPEVFVAAVYDAGGTLFASFARAADHPAPARARAQVPSFDQDRLVVTVPVVQDAKPLGMVYLQTVTEPITSRLERYAVLALLVVMASVVVAVLGAAHAALSQANVKLDAANRELRDEMAQREQAEDALRQAQKMEAVGQLTGGVAHDFNNLLQVILASLDVVARRLEHGGIIIADDVRRPVLAAMRAGDRAANLTRRLLAFARRQPLAPRPLDVNRLVAGMSEMLHRTLGEGVDIETVLASGLWRVSADSNQVENSLLNLAVNARDAMASGGKLTIETANAFLDENYAAAHEDVRPGQYVVISVADTGVGMTSEIVRQAFDPFFTTKEVGQGTGLGLSQVYGFVKQSGGHVKIYSEPGEGTTVKLYFPRLMTADVQADPRQKPSDSPRGTPEDVVLVVEDEADVRGLTVEMLRELGYGVVEAEDGPTALRLLEAMPAVRLLFTDIGLPGGLTGRQVAEAARRLRPDLLVLYTTGYARNSIVHHGRLDAGVELIAKPFTSLALATKIRSLLDRGG